MQVPLQFAEKLAAAAAVPNSEALLLSPETASLQQLEALAKRAGLPIGHRARLKEYFSRTSGSRQSY